MAAAYKPDICFVLSQLEKAEEELIRIRDMDCEEPGFTIRWCCQAAQWASEYFDEKEGKG